MATDGAGVSASTWAPLRIGVFRGLFIAALTSNIGTWMQTVGGAVVSGRKKGQPNGHRAGADGQPDPDPLVGAIRRRTRRSGRPQAAAHRGAGVCGSRRRSVDSTGGRRRTGCGLADGPLVRHRLRCCVDDPGMAGDPARARATRATPFRGVARWCRRGCGAGGRPSHRRSTGGCGRRRGGVRHQCGVLYCSDRRAAGLEADAFGPGNRA